MCLKRNRIKYLSLVFILSNLTVSKLFHGASVLQMVPINRSNLIRTVPISSTNLVIVPHYLPPCASMTDGNVRRTSIPEAFKVPQCRISTHRITLNLTEVLQLSIDARITFSNLGRWPCDTSGSLYWVKCTLYKLLVSRALIAETASHI